MDAARNDGQDPRYRRGAEVVLFNAQAQVWVGQRIDNPNPAWQMPQGGLDPHEHPFDTAQRELEEETGVAPALTRAIDSPEDWLTYDFPDELRQRLWRGSYLGQQQRWFAFSFLGRDTDVNIATPHPEFSAWKWVELEQTIDLIVPFKRELYSQIIRAFIPIRDRLRDGSHRPSKTPIR